MKTLIIVTNWNDQFRTLRCIKSLLKINSNDSHNSSVIFSNKEFTLNTQFTESSKCILRPEHLLINPENSDG